MYCFIRSDCWYVYLSSQILLILIGVLEILVDVVDVVLEGSGIDEKFLGISLFALVPNTTEFMNAMSFAINGNIALRYVMSYKSTIRCLISVQYGDWFRIRTSSLPPPNPCNGGILSRLSS